MNTTFTIESSTLNCHCFHLSTHMEIEQSKNRPEKTYEMAGKKMKSGVCRKAYK